MNQICFSCDTLVRVAFAQEDVERRRREAMVASREREVIARDVHDLLGHSLTIVVLKAQLAQRLTRVDPDRTEQELADLLRVAQSALDDVRATVGRLRSLDLASQVDHSVSALRDAGLDVEVSGSWEPYEPDERALAAWAIREATTNILRHAAASNAEITFARRSFTIIDDGVGITADSAASEAHGLTGLRSRVEDAGAELVLSQAHPETARPGTRVEVRFA